MSLSAADVEKRIEDLKSKQVIAKKAWEKAGNKDLLRFLVEILRKSQSPTTDLQRPYGFLKSLLIVLPYAHHFTYGLHLRTQLIFQPFKFLKCLPCKLNNHIIAGRGILLKGSVAPIRYFIHCQSTGKQR